MSYTEEEQERLIKAMKEVEKNPLFDYLMSKALVTNGYEAKKDENNRLRAAINAHYEVAQNKEQSSISYTNLWRILDAMYDQNERAYKHQMLQLEAEPDGKKS